MRTLISKLLLAGMAFALSAIPASAQTQITLLGTSSGSITFTGTGAGTGGSNLSMTLGSCSLGATCITGSASGTDGLTSSGFYSISGGPVTLTSTSMGNWSASGTLSFAYNTLADFTGTNLLSGTLDLVNLSQSGASGTFNTNLVANLTGLTGSLASVFTPAGGITQVFITIASGTDLSALSVSSTATATIASGTIVPTPEPGSMVLLGSGLLAVGAFLRRRLARPV